MNKKDEFYIETPTRFFNLMKDALKKKMCLSLEFHIDGEDGVVLLASIYFIDRKKNVIFSKFSRDETELFFQCRNFIDNIIDE